jgi:chitin disaccharide deacetylase
MKLKILSVIFLLAVNSMLIFPQEKVLLIRCDDMGMSHSVNMAFEELFKTGIPVSASIMFPCSWYPEAVEIIKKYPNVSAGVHLTLNAEWKNYRWGPVLGKTAVPTLVDGNGYFFPSRASFYANNPSVSDVENELRAQVERAINSGLKIDYLDYHMGTAMDKPEYRDIVEKLAKEYKVGISRYFGEYTTNNMYNDPLESKEDSLLHILQTLTDSSINLLVCHIGMDDPELRAMEDMNTFGLKEMSRHRYAELMGLLSVRTNEFFKSGKIKLINYTDLKNLELKRPLEFSY